MSSSEVELVKELVFGAAFGACAGYVSKKLGSKFVAGAATATFVALRLAIFNGQHLATWSPLAQDDPSFGSYLQRKARRETKKEVQKAQIFFTGNLVVLGGFAGGLCLTSC